MGAGSSVLPAPNDPLGVLHRDTSVATFDEDDCPDDQYHHQHEEHDAQQTDLTGLHLVERRDDRTRQTDDDAGKDQQRHAVADTAFGNLLAEPHHEHGARRQREHTQQAEPQPRVVDEGEPPGNLRLPFEPDRDTQRLHDRQQKCEVTRVLGDLPATELALFRDLLEGRRHYRHQLEDDRRTDVRHHAKRENRHPLEVASGEHVVHAKHRAGSLFSQNRQRLGIHPGRGNASPHPVHPEHRERKQHTIPQVGDSE